ncbi:hypothetical protein MMC28_006264 [Mycoblastus sanguinarius]|nr:hypothetical protein [Mycoblastus sanguinarius]
MTPHLHPRSRLTTSLFGTTLLVSFLVVSMPHIVPCPAPRVKFADAELEITADGRRRRRRRRLTESPTDASSDEDSSSVQISEEEKIMMRRKSHECPVPKPRGLVGEVLGFKKKIEDDTISAPRIETRKLEKGRKEER